MADVITLGNVPWSRSDMLQSLEEFSELYAKRPIKDNTGGMKSAHMFASWFALKMLQPKTIIESGIWFGQGTWLFEQACPEAELHCIDINLRRIQYRSKRARYYKQDFSTIDWNHLSKEETLLFFDDHQNAYERVKTASWFGFKHLMFEDNYPASSGDCYSLKKVFSHTGFIPHITEAVLEKPPVAKPKPFRSQVKQMLVSILASLTDIPVIKPGEIPPNRVDAGYLRQNLEIYYEFPPIFRVDQTRWGDPWDDDKYPTPAPLLTSCVKTYEQVFLDEALDYSWICYAKLK